MRRIIPISAVIEVTNCNKCGRFVGIKEHTCPEILVFTPEHRKKLSLAGTGHKVSEETKLKIGLANKGRIRSPETIEKMRIASSNCSEETRRKISISQKGRIKSVETRKNISFALKGRIFTPEHRHNLSLAMKGKTISAATRKKISNTNTGRVISLETRRKMGLASKGRILSLAARQKISMNHRHYQSIEMKRKVSIKSKKMWENQEFRKNISMKHKISRARQVLPKRDTKIEVKIQNFLKELKIEFFTHQYMYIKNRYQCDIFIAPQKGMPQKTIIECDGDYWHGNLNVFPIEKISQRMKIKRVLDFERTYQLEEQGFRVIRLWENEINKMDLEEFKNILFLRQEVLI